MKNMIDDNEAKQIRNYINDRISKLVTNYQSANNKHLAEDSEEFEWLVQNLQSKNTAIQCQAVLALGELGNINAIVPPAQTYYFYEREQPGYFDYLPDVLRIATAATLYKLGEYIELSEILSSPPGYVRPRIQKAVDEVDDR